MNILKNKNCNIKINDEEIPIELYRKTNNEFVKYVRYDDYKKLENIIKEVREYIEEWQRFPHTNGSTHKELKNLIDILDRESK